jgi:hypothetical protein
MVGRAIDVRKPGATGRFINPRPASESTGRNVYRFHRTERCGETYVYLWMRTLSANEFGSAEATRRRQIAAQGNHTAQR